MARARYSETLYAGVEAVMRVTAPISLNVPAFGHRMPSEADVSKALNGTDWP